MCKNGPTLLSGESVMPRQRNYLKIRNLAVTIFLPLCIFIQSPVFADECSRDCLTDLITLYVDAIVAHDPSMLPLVENVRYTEDSNTATFGEGIWQSVTGSEKFRHDYLDISKQIAASQVLLREGETQVWYSVLLYVKDNKITGVETLVVRVTPESESPPAELVEVVQGMNDPVPADKKQSRDSMIKTALTYAEGLRVGNFTDGETPFASGAVRVENGVLAAGKDCPRAECGLYTQRLILHPGIIASVAAVDEEMGVVLLWMNFGHTGDYYGKGNALVTFEAFKVWGGEIHSINAFFKGLPLATSRFWPSSDPITEKE
jgi:hypothetical protein